MKIAQKYLRFGIYKFNHVKSKNILISFGVLCMGLILYKFLIGFVLPIALFVSLGYVLKFLLTGSNSDASQEVNQTLMNDMKSTTSKNVVEIKPIEEKKTNDELKTNVDVNIS